MSIVSLTGNDLVKVNDRILNDLADGDVVTVSFPNDLMTVKTGKNGNSIYAVNETGHQSDVVIRLIRGSSDDKFMNSLLTAQKIDTPGFTLMRLDFSKRMGDGEGNITNDVNTLTGGVFKKTQPEVKDNTEGDTDQAVSIYELQFTGDIRLIG